MKEWIQTVADFSKLLLRAPVTPGDAKQPAAIVVVQPWQCTTLPWFMILFGLAMQQRGRRIHFVFDDIPFGADSQVQVIQRMGIELAFRALATHFQCTALSTVAPSPDESLPEAEVERLARMNAVKEYRGEVLPPEGPAFLAAAGQSLKAAAQRIATLLKQHAPEYIVVAGGVYVASGAWLAVGRKLGIRVATLDSGRGRLLTAADGIAANLDDIPRAMELLPDDPGIEKRARAEMTLRLAGRDRFSSQVAESTGRGEAYGVLLPLNQSYDTSAIHRHRAFDDQLDWMLKTAGWVLKETGETIVIRQHPVERFPELRSTDPFVELLAEHFGDNPRVRFIAADESVNTYDLMDRCKVVVPYVSTVGIEGVCRGKVVVTEGASCYAGLGFVHSARTAEEYFELLRRGLNGELCTTPEQASRAWRCYYLTQCLNFFQTTITPINDDFNLWVKDDPKKLLDSDTMQVLFETYDRNIPLPILNHARVSAAAQ
jgi:hypothetical protein